MKTTISLCFVLIATAGMAQHTLEKIWESDTTLATPESVLYDDNGLYVSLIDGKSSEADGKGGIAKLDKNGKIINATWVTGLSAPKGMGLWNKKLYVTDITEVVVINTATGKIETKISPPGAVGLNDLTIDDKGVIYASDAREGTVYQIKNGKPELYLTDLKGINGLKSVGNELYILASGGVYKAGADKKVTQIATMEIGGDGIEPIGNGDFIVTSWIGIIYYLSKDGTLQTLLDTRDQKKNTADIGYNTKERIVYVPTFYKKSVVAYKLK
jgi:hypothetical protein